MTTPKTLFLHIGHSKTGSSYLQSCLALSASILAKKSIAYPDGGTHDNAASGNVTSGNWQFLTKALEAPPAFDDIPEKAVLISSELLFRELQDTEFQKRLAGLIGSQDVDSTEVLLFIRDPVSHACASYGQKVKGGGLTATLEEYLDGFPSSPNMVRKVVSFLETLPRVRISILNYSRERKNLVPALEEWLGIELGTLLLPESGTVNRSLTVCELQLMRHLNERIPETAFRFGNSFVNELPNIPGDVLRPSLEMRNELWERWREDIDWVNSKVGPEHSYDRMRDLGGREKSPAGEDSAFSDSQLKVIADLIAEAIRRREKLQADIHDLQHRLRKRIQQNDAQQAEIERQNAEIERLRSASLLDQVRRRLRTVRRA